MTRIERQTAEAVIALLEAVSFLRGGAKITEDLRSHRIALRASLDADPAPAACDPYATASPPFSRPGRLLPTQQYDAEEPTGA